MLEALALYNTFPQTSFMNKVQFDLAEDLPDICWDNVFKSIFTSPSPESRGALSKLLSAIIGKGLTVINISANEPPVESLRDRQIRFDINCVSDEGQLCNVEMTLSPGAFEVRRLEYYAGELHTSQDIRGADKSWGDLKPSYQISFLINQVCFDDKVFIHSVDMPVLSVYTSYPGAGPSDVEQNVTAPLERALASTKGLTDMMSSSSFQSSNINLNFAYGTDMDKMASDIQSVINRVNLPDNAGSPTVRRFDMSASPIMNLVVRGNYPANQLRIYAEDEIQAQVERIEGVAAASVIGGTTQQIGYYDPKNRVTLRGISRIITIELDETGENKRDTEPRGGNSDGRSGITDDKSGSGGAAAAFDNGA